MRCSLMSVFCRLLPAAALVLQPTFALEETISAKTYFPESGFPLAEQRRLAARLLGKGWLRDVEVEDYLQRVAKQLIPQDEHFIVIADTDQVNAFAYLGGLVVIYRGLWQFAEEEDGFVGILAHELGHVKLDHVQKSRDNAERISTLTTPLIIAGLLIDEKEVREALVASGAGLLGSGLVTYSRELEHEADIYALDAMQRSMRDAQALARIFSRLGGGGNEYLSTHPASARRAAYLSQRLLDAPPASVADTNMDYHLLREKLARYGVVEQQYQQKQRALLASAAASGQKKIVARYGLLLSATQTRNSMLGAEMTAALAGEKNPIIVRALVENMRRRGAGKEALPLLQEARRAAPERVALVLELFAVHERLKQYNKVLSVYEELPSPLKERPEILLAAARAAAFVQQHVFSNYLLALGYALDGEFEQAKRQIAVAEKFDDGDIALLTELQQLKKKIERELQLLQEKKMPVK